MNDFYNSIWKNKNYRKVLSILLNNIPDNYDEEKQENNGNTENNEKSIVEKFIFSQDVQKVFYNINHSVMDINLFEIAGMGDQEIKHSNVLAWLFGDNEHQLGYEILDSFLLSGDEKKRELQSYIYLAEKKRELNIYREKDNIDLLIEDKQNKVVIVIENKVNSKESKDQLKKYAEKIDKTYKGYRQYFVYLTKRGDKTETAGDNNNWMIRSYQDIVDIIEEILKRDNELSLKTIMILENYIDLLERKGIVKNQYIANLDTNWWNNYKEALAILKNYQPDEQLEISNYIRELINEKAMEHTNSSGKKVTFYDKQNNMKDNHLYYEFRSDKKGMPLLLGLGKATDDNRERCDEIYIQFIGSANSNPNWQWATIRRSNLYDGDLLEDSMEKVKSKIKENFNNAIEDMQKLIIQKTFNVHKS